MSTIPTPTTPRCGYHESADKRCTLAATHYHPTPETLLDPAHAVGYCSYHAMRMRRDGMLGIRIVAGHHALPTRSGTSESTCTVCGGRVTARANRHGYMTWAHRETGR
jgi:hypothetical protein